MVSVLIPFDQIGRGKIVGVGNGYIRPIVVV